MLPGLGPDIQTAILVIKLDITHNPLNNLAANCCLTLISARLTPLIWFKWLQHSIIQHVAAERGPLIPEAATE